MVRRELWRGIPVGQQLCLPVEGEFACPSGGSGHLHGDFRLQGLQRTSRQVSAVGAVGGVLVDADGQTIGRAGRRIFVSLESGTTASLREALNQLDVDLLGLRVTLHVSGSRAPTCGSH